MVHKFTTFVWIITATASLASVHFAETKHKKSEHVSRPTDTSDAGDASHKAPRGKSQPSKAVSLHGEPWYNEVVELRRQAHDYKVTILYNKENYEMLGLKILAPTKLNS